MRIPRVFVSYSHQDPEWCARVETHLNAWTDRNIVAGEDWSESIRAELDAAEVAVLLVSPGFLASEFIRAVEVPALLARKGVRVLPVLVKGCDFPGQPWLARIQFHGGTTPLETFPAGFARIMSIRTELSVSFK